jgi:hypothetical protein
VEPSSPEHRRHLGRRLSILYRLEEDDEHPFSEAVGYLQRIDGDGENEVLVLTRPDASTVEVKASAIVRLKIVA